MKKLFVLMMFLLPLISYGQTTQQRLEALEFKVKRLEDGMRQLTLKQNACCYKTDSIESVLHVYACDWVVYHLAIGFYYYPDEDLAALNIADRLPTDVCNLAKACIFTEDATVFLQYHEWDLTWYPYFVAPGRRVF